MYRDPSLRSTEKPPAARPRLVLAGALLSMVLAALDQNIVNTALPRIVGELGGWSHVSWVVTVFMLTATTTTMLYGRLSDTYGRRRLFFLAIGLFLTGSLLCGLAQSMLQLIVLRGLQGLGAGGLLVLAQAVIGDVFSPRERPRYQGLITGVFAFASVAGPLIGGGITSLWSWRWVFFVNLPIAAVAVILIAVGLKDKTRGRVGRLDGVGTALLALGTACLLLWLSWGGSVFPWVSWPSGVMLVVFLGLLHLFVRWEMQVANPLVRLELLRMATYARGVAVGGMMTFAMMGSTVFLPLYFQLVLGMDPAVAGAMLLPQVGGMMLTSIIGGRVVSRLGSAHKFLLAGVAVEVVALGSLAGFAAMDAGAVWFLLSTWTLGLGLGMGMPNLTVTVQNAVPYRELGAATGMMTFIRSLGGALGVAVSGAILAAHLTAQFGDRLSLPRQAGDMVHLSATEHAAMADVYHGALMWCFGVSTGVMALAWLLIHTLPDHRLRDQIVEEEPVVP